MVELDNFEEYLCHQHVGTSSHNPTSSRLKESKELNVLDKAKERARVKDLEKRKGETIHIGGGTSTSHYVLVQILNSVQLGICSYFRKCLKSVQSAALTAISYYCKERQYH